MATKRNRSEEIEFADPVDDAEIERMLAEAERADDVLELMHADEIAASYTDPRAEQHSGPFAPRRRNRSRAPRCSVDRGLAALRYEVQDRGAPGLGAGGRIHRAARQGARSQRGRSGATSRLVAHAMEPIRVQHPRDFVQSEKSGALAGQGKHATGHALRDLRPVQGRRGRHRQTWATPELGSLVSVRPSDLHLVRLRLRCRCKTLSIRPDRRRPESRGGRRCVLGNHIRAG